ncbi:hypothetical protein IL306_008044 [Fusarium sp. DS 682]|nr:hypothetical protein IL306_008044 [Fusarium sp. DS 682]
MSYQVGDAASRLQDTVADGRLANPFYRQQQLRKIQKSLIERRDTLIEALIKDSLVTSNEAFTELYSTVAAVKSFFDQTSPTKQLEAEYAVARNQDAPLARQGLGIVVIKLQFHTYLFSTISPICAALASGNAVLLIVKETLRCLPLAVIKLLKESLDPGIVEIATSEPDRLGASLSVDQVADDRLPDTLSCPQQARTVAIVDRTCVLKDAARSLWFARTAFGGASPYAPDIIFVNEFIKTDFLKALVTCCLDNHDAYPSDSNGHASAKDSVTGKLVQGLKCISAGAWGQIVEITQSLEDVIEAANNFSRDTKLATFAFGDPKTCKYILQFVNTDAGFANVVPKELFVGPAAPRGYPIELGTRYSLPEDLTYGSPTQRVGGKSLGQ